MENDVIRDMHVQFDTGVDYIEESSAEVEEAQAVTDGILHIIPEPVGHYTPTGEPAKAFGHFGEAVHISGENVEREASAPTERVECGGGD